MKSIFRFLLLGVVFFAPIWLIQTASSDPGVDDPEFFVYLPTVFKSPILLNNGDFEAGRTHWSQYSSNSWWLIVHKENMYINPHSGVWSAWLGGDDYEDSILGQEVTITADNPILTYWLWIDSEDACGYDVGGVFINTSTVVDSYDLCAANNTGGWIKREINLSAYSGSTTILEFAAFTDGYLISNLFVDDVSIGDPTFDSNLMELTYLAPFNLPLTKPAELVSPRLSESGTVGLTAHHRLIALLEATGG